MENVRALNDELTVYLSREPKPYRIVGQHENDAREFTFTAFCEPIPVRFSVMSGEIVHHLRSSLDHLVWALIVRNNKTPTNNSHFPIGLTPKNFEQSCKSGAISGVSPSAKKIIESAQPYHRADPANSSLNIVRDCDNTDKHSLLLVVAATSRFPGTLKIVDAPGWNAERIAAEFGPLGSESIVTFEMINQMIVPQRMREEGTKILTIPFAKPAPFVQFEVDFVPEIVFDEFGAGKLVPMIPILNALCNDIIAVVRLLVGEFI